MASLIKISNFLSKPTKTDRVDVDSRKLLFLLWLVLLANIVSSSAFAETNDSKIYSIALKTIVEHEQPKMLAISNQKVGQIAMKSSRVPRHDPYGQFTRSLPGLKKNLEQALVDGTVGKKEEKKIDEFSFTFPGVSFSGFISYQEIAQAEKNSRNGLYVVGFSDVAYSNNGRDALLYAEICLISNGDTCSGEAFWLIRDSSDWQIKKHAYLWAGSDVPFWSMK